MCYWQALHIAVLRRRASVVLALLDANFPPEAPSQGRWTALDDAIALKDKELVKLLHSRQTAAVKADLKAKKGQLLNSLTDMPNVSFQASSCRSAKIHLLPDRLERHTGCAPSGSYIQHGKRIRVESIGPDS